MKPLSSFAEYLVTDAFALLDGVSTKNMFGGVGFYLDGAIFAFTIDDDRVVFKVDDSNRAQYEALESEQFIYEGHTNKGPVGMPYWTVPPEILEDPVKTAEWARQSAAISRKRR